LQGLQYALGPETLPWHFKWESLAYYFDSVCASTTAMIHLAYMSLLSKEIGMVVAGTANVLSYA
jgi:zearalenone synthase (nonreducing iterative type I polyketide synthase)